jgi:phospholipid/cholesterol/gamma-HCH transport system substrate-binding protein
MMEEDVRFRHMERKIGIFTALALAGLAAAIFFIGMEKDLFTQKYTLRFTVENATGFANGMPVMLSGFHIGRVSSIALKDRAMVEIDIQIDRKYQKWIRKDSAVQLTKQRIIGDAAIEVSLGSAASEMLKEGDTITYVKTMGLEELATNIADKVKPVLIEVRDIISYVNDPNGDIKQSLHNIRQVTAGLEATRRRADALLASSGTRVDAIAGSALKTLDNGNSKIDRLQPVLEKADASLAKLPPMLEKMATTLDHVEKTTAQLQATATQTLPRVPPLVRRTEDILEGVDSTINAVQDIWPIRNHIPPEGTRTILPGDSHD